MIRSLRMRLFLGTTLVSAILLSILCFTLITALGHTLQGEFDRVLLEKARTLASLVEQDGSEIHFDYRRSLFPEFELGEHPDYFEILLDGKPYIRSLSLEDHYLDMGATAPPTPPTAVVLPNGQPGRRITLVFAPLVEQGTTPVGPAHTAVLALALKTDDLTRTLNRIRLMVISLCAAATLTSGIALLVVVRRAVAPVKILASQIESIRIAPDAASNALFAAPFPSELAPVVDRLNDMLQRLSAAFSRERAFTADAAHELRTPLAGLLTTLEVCRTRPRNSPEYETAIDRCLGILRRMQGMIEKLLLLSRADSGQVTVNAGPVDLMSIVLDCRQTFETGARAKGITFAHAGEETLLPAAEAGAPTGNYLAMADAELMQIVFNNLFDNAVNYSSACSTIQIEMERKGDRLLIRVTNSGHALTPADLPRLFERFWRKDTSRTGTGIHAGLGLSLCQRLMVLQRGGIATQLEGELFVIRLDLPAA